MVSEPILVAKPDDRETWLKARESGIGASEIAAVMGISPWESPFSLYWRKREGWHVEPTEQMRDGLLLEPSIAAWWQETQDPHENLHISHGALYAHPDRPWQLATPDRLVRMACDCAEEDLVPDEHSTIGAMRCTVCDGWGIGPVMAVLELKWCPGGWDGWGEPDTDDIPVHYRAQVLWQCDVMGVDEWYLAALGPGGFRQYRGLTDQADIEAMRQAAAAFMDRLHAGDAPDLDSHNATLATLKRLHSDLDDTEVEVDPAVAGEYLAAVDAFNGAEVLKRHAEIALRNQMGRARRAVSDGQKVATHVITDIPESIRTVAAHRRDYLLPPREKK